MEMYQYTCTKCGKVHHPRYIVCQNPDCDGREFEKAPLGGKCKLLTWTRAYNLPEGFEMPWLNFGIVEFPNGVRATGQIGFDEGIESGMELYATTAKVRDKVIKYKETVPESKYGFVFTRL
ncbi:MAG: hypothetical protein FWF10_06715 [Clostridiales bacterium]|nr:hypothetical protein [Clostridiales bacterium]